MLDAKRPNRPDTSLRDEMSRASAHDQGNRPLPSLAGSVPYPGI